MADTAILRPTADAPGAGFTFGTGVWTRAGGRVAGAQYSGYDEASLDESDSGYALARTTDASYNPGRYEAYFSAPPTGVAIVSLTLKAYMRTSSAGPYFFAEDPRVKGFVMVGATRYYQSGPAYVTVVEFCNRNTTGDVGTYGLYTVGTWATNPATAAAWTLADLAAGNFIAGLEAGGVAEGQAANGIPNAYGGSTADFDLGQLWVEITTTPSETFVNPIRVSASAILRLFGRPLRLVEFSAPVQYSDVKPGSTIYLSHSFYPTEDGLGVGLKDHEQRPVKVLSVSDQIEPPEIRIKALDIIDRACTFWSTWRTDVGADTVNLSGIPRFDLGGGYTVARTSADWVERPTDRLLVSISAARPRITPFGLLVQGGSFPGYGAGTGEHSSYFKNNSFSQGVGGHGTLLANGDTTGFTSWTVTSTGGGAVYVSKNTNFRFDDPTTYARHALIIQGANYASDTAYLSQLLASHGANYRLRAQLIFKAYASTLSPGEVSYVLRRKIGATNYDWTTGGWSTSLAWRKLVDAQTSTGGFGKTSFRKYGQFYEYWTDEVDFGVSVADLTLFAGYTQQNAAGIYLHQAKVYNNVLGTGQAKRVLRRVYDVTQASNVTNAADVVDLNNDSSYRIARTDRGTLSFVFVPLFDHDDLDDGADKYLLTLSHDSTNGDREELFYHRSSSVAGILYFRRVYGNATNGEATIGLYAAAGDTPDTRPQYMVAMKIAARWLGASGELGLAPKTLDVFFGGVKGTSGVATQYCRQKTTGAFVAIGRKSTGAPGSSVNPYQFADGYFSDMEFRADVLSDVQVAAIHNRSGQNLPLPSVVS